MPFAKTTAIHQPPVGHAPDTPDTVDTLGRQLAVEPDPARRARLLTALVAVDTSAAAAALAGLLAHADPAVRACGVDGLRRIRPVLARPALGLLLADPSPDIRVRALDAVERVPDAQIEGWLIAMIEREGERADGDGNVCAVVLDLLAEIGTPAALPAIRAARLRFASEPFIAFAADHAITQIAEG